MGNSPLRQRILFFASALILMTLLGSTVSLYRITEVNRSLQAINHVSVPLGRLLTQLNSDAEVLRREAERRLGIEHWKDSRWRPRPMPRWLEDVITSELSRTLELIASDQPWTDPATRTRWREWAQSARAGFSELSQKTVELQKKLEQAPGAASSELVEQHLAWSRSLDEWARDIQWGAEEYERTLRQGFARAQDRVSALRTALEFILVLLITLSLALLWLGERALRPLAELTKLASSIARRGLRKEDKQNLMQVPLTRNDEVSSLGREFHRMATALLERERTVEQQRDRLQEGNRKLQAMGALNENILRSIESVLIVTDREGRITQCNPATEQWLDSRSEAILGSRVSDWPRLAAFAVLAERSHARHSDASKDRSIGSPVRIEQAMVDGRTWGGRIYPLRTDDGGESSGDIIVLEDLTDERAMAERLQAAENMAAVGRLSAQVAHEVRNPLHSIGLEAEMALEEARAATNPRLKQSVQSILASVDRLAKITDNYLKLSRLSSGVKTDLCMGDVLESVLAAYSTVCQSQGVRVEWARESGAELRVLGDRDLIEQAIGNLFRNSLQALEGIAHPIIRVELGANRARNVTFVISDNGPGIPVAHRDRLFTPFVTTKASGTGLGLSFVRHVAEDHGGAVRLDPEYSSGARFVFELPQTSVGARKEPRHAENPLS